MTGAKVRDGVFRVWLAGVTVVYGLAFVWMLAAPKRWGLPILRLWAHTALWGLAGICGVRRRVEGEAPDRNAPMLVAAKHQSPWETIAAFVILKDPVIVLKRELMAIPIYGWWARKLGMIPIDREGRVSAIRDMTKRARQAFAEGRSVVIFPEGTRQAPGAPPSYKPGVAALYRALDRPCLPVALNSGLYWRADAPKSPGVVTWRFLDPIESGLPRKSFMRELEESVETATHALLEEGTKKEHER